MGDRARLDPRPGGEFTLFFGDNAVEGQYLELDAPRRLLISWGRRASDEFPPSTSTLEVTLVAEGDGTRVSIVHSGLPQDELPKHAAGWSRYLPRLAIVVTRGSVR